MGINYGFMTSLRNEDCSTYASFSSLLVVRVCVSVYVLTVIFFLASFPLIILYKFVGSYFII